MSYYPSSAERAWRAGSILTSCKFHSVNMALYFVFDCVWLTWNHLLHKTAHIKDQNFLHTYFFFEADLISILNLTFIKPQSSSIIARYPSSVNINIATQGDLLCVDWCHLDVLLCIYLLPLLFRKVFIFLLLGC